jgi:uncharacterized protein YhbP (UPF0306 family)
MPVARSEQRPSAQRLTRIARTLLDAAPLCAIATVTRTGRAYVNTAYFAWSPRFEIVWLSAPEARHSRNLERQRSAAIAVFDTHQTWADRDRGIQMFGTAAEARGSAKRDAERLYARRFRHYETGSLQAYRFYRFRPRTVKVFHEQLLGGGTFVTARVDTTGRLRWMRTEVYEAD